MSHLIDILCLPVELIQRLLTFCHPSDVAAFSQTCHQAHNLVYHADQHLWRELFLTHPFDDPRAISNDLISELGLECSVHTDDNQIDWRRHVHRRTKAEKTAYAQTPNPLDRREAFETFISLVKNAPPFIPEVHDSKSLDLEWLERLLSKSRFMDDILYATEATPSAQLRTYIAGSLDNDIKVMDRTTALRLRERRNTSRSFVYDLRHYNAATSWGPYLTDGSVNWIHVESLMNVILMNFRELPSLWAHTKPPTGLEATRPYSAPGNRSPNDWAGVEGTWMRYVCFMDYRDLFTFNYSDVGNGPRDPAFFRDPRFREATRLIEVKLRLIPKDKIRFKFGIHHDSANSQQGDNGRDEDDGNDDGEGNAHRRHPPLYFSGSAKGVDGNHAVVEGTVRMIADGVVRWQFVSVYDGHTQWSSDGAQVGNVASAMGVVGVWTTALHDQGDPVGPFWLWKVEDDYSTIPMEYT